MTPSPHMLSTNPVSDSAPVTKAAAPARSPSADRRLEVRARLGDPPDRHRHVRELEVHGRPGDVVGGASASASASSESASS